MIFNIGAILIIVGLVMLFIVFRKSRRPRVDAYVNEITLDYYYKDKAQRKKYPHGLIKYVYKSIEYEAKIFLLKRKVEVGDQVVVSFKERNPEKPVMYVPKSEIIAGFVIICFGLIFIWLNAFLMDYFELW